MAINSKATTLMGNLKEKEDMNGQMEATMKEILKAVIEMGKGCFKSLTAQFTKVITLLP